MKLPLILSAAMALSLGTLAAKEKPAKAELKDASGATVGTATFKEAAGGVQLAVKITKAKPGQHGIHIHAAGKCEAPDFKSAAGHFNPAQKHHGAENPQGPHGGDLPNITVGANGKGTLTQTVPGITLGTDEHGLFHTGGTALVLHADPDDLKTDPAGNAGARVACGVVTR